MKSIQGDLRNVILPSKWEALLNNLGHTCRKMKKYDEALEYHQQALVLDPLNPSTYSSIGFIHALMGNIQEAVDAFHRALGLRKDDTFTATMLGYVMEQLIDEAPPYPGTLTIESVLYRKDDDRRKITVNCIENLFSNLLQRFVRKDLLTFLVCKNDFIVLSALIDLIFIVLLNSLWNLINFSDAPMEIPKYKSEENKTRLSEDSEVRLSVENPSNVGSSSSSQNIDKLRVNLFSGNWGENSGKAEASTQVPGKLEQQTRDVLVVNYSNGDSSEVEMLDSSTAHIEYN